MGLFGGYLQPQPTPPPPTQPPQPTTTTAKTKPDTIIPNVRDNRDFIADFMAHYAHGTYYVGNSPLACPQTSLNDQLLNQFMAGQAKQQCQNYIPLNMASSTLYALFKAVGYPADENQWHPAGIEDTYYNVAAQSLYTKCWNFLHNVYNVFADNINNGLITIPAACSLSGTVPTPPATLPPTYPPTQPTTRPTQPTPAPWTPQPWTQWTPAPWSQWTQRPTPAPWTPQPWTQWTPAPTPPPIRTRSPPTVSTTTVSQGNGTGK